MKNINVFFLAVILLFVNANLQAARKKHNFVQDKLLESRLKVKKTYISRQDDNLKRIAYRLYGHRSWWIRIKNKNSNLKKYAALDKVKVGTKIKYVSPVVEENYIVQKNDTLSRVAEWKYANLDFWERIYKNNIDIISDPNQIKEGDQLLLSKDGTIKIASTGKVLVDPKRQLPVQQVQVVQAIPVDDSIVIKIPPVYREHIIIIIIFAIIIMSILLFIYKIIQLQIKKQRLALGLKIGNISKLKHRKYLQNNFEIDKSLIRQDNGELNSGISYQSLREKWWKKYLLLNRIKKS